GVFHAQSCHDLDQVIQQLFRVESGCVAEVLAQPFFGNVQSEMRHDEIGGLPTCNYSKSGSALAIVLGRKFAAAICLAGALRSARSHCTCTPSVRLSGALGRS